MSDPRDKAFEIAGHLRVCVTDLEILAADIGDLEVDRLVEQVRLDVIRLGDRLARLRVAGRAAG